MLQHHRPYVVSRLMQHSTHNCINAELYLQDIYTWVTHGQGILGSQGDYNAKHRRLCSPMFRTPKLLKKFSHVITERSVELTNSLAEAAGARGGIDMDISLHTQRLTLDIVGLTAFSHDFNQVLPSFLPI
jgi:Cytochrome P450